MNPQLKVNIRWYNGAGDYAGRETSTLAEITARLDCKGKQTQSWNGRLAIWRLFTGEVARVTQ